MEVFTMKRRIVFLLSLILCLSFPIYSIAMGSEHVLNTIDNTATAFDTLKMTNEELEIYKKAQDQYDAVIFYDKLVSAFMDKYGEIDGQPARYPDNYAGAYISDRGKLVVQITKINDHKISGTDSIKDYLGYVDIPAIKEKDTEFKAESIEELIEFEQVDYSLNELNGMLANSVDNVSKKFPVTGYYVDTRNNTINLSIEASSYEKANTSIDTYKSSKLTADKEIPLVFEVGEVTEPAAYHIGGQGYYYHGSDGGRTLGFAGWYNGQRAYLSCGHSSKFKVGDTAKYGSTTVGTIADKQWSNNGNGDWSIAYLNSGETMGGLIKQNSSGTIVGKIKARVNSVAIGTIVYRFGNASQGWSSLEVKGINITMPWTDVGTNTTYNIKSQVKCELKTGPAVISGDSGGPYVIANGSDYSAVGTTTGANSGFMYFSPMSCVPSNFAVEIGY
jgi:hypothetical protein